MKWTLKLRFLSFLLESGKIELGLLRHLKRSQAGCVQGFLFGHMFASNTVAMATSSCKDDQFFAITVHLFAAISWVTFGVQYLHTGQFCENCSEKHFN